MELILAFNPLERDASVKESALAYVLAPNEDSMMSIPSTDEESRIQPIAQRGPRVEIVADPEESLATMLRNRLPPSLGCRAIVKRILSKDNGRRRLVCGVENEAGADPKVSSKRTLSCADERKKASTTCSTELRTDFARSRLMKRSAS